jgi:hypothetical protein
MDPIRQPQTSDMAPVLVAALRRIPTPSSADPDFLLDLHVGTPELLEHVSQLASREPDPWRGLWAEAVGRRRGNATGHQSGSSARFRGPVDRVLSTPGASRLKLGLLLEGIDQCDKRLLVPVRARIASEADPVVLATMCELLGVFGEAEDEAVLSGQLSHPDQRVILRVIQALERLPAHIPDPQMVRLLDRKEPPIVSLAGAHLLKRNPAYVVGFVRRVFAGASVALRLALISVLAHLNEIEPVTAGPVLLELLKEEEDERVQGALARSVTAGFADLKPHAYRLIGPVWELREASDPPKRAIIDELLVKLARPLGWIERGDGGAAEWYVQHRASLRPEPPADPAQVVDSPPTARPRSDPAVITRRMVLDRSSSGIRRIQSGVQDRTGDEFPRRPPTLVLSLCAVSLMAGWLLGRGPSNDATAEPTVPVQAAARVRSPAATRRGPTVPPIKEGVSSFSGSYSRRATRKEESTDAVEDQMELDGTVVYHSPTQTLVRSGQHLVAVDGPAAPSLSVGQTVRARATVTGRDATGVFHVRP